MTIKIRVDETVLLLKQIMAYEAVVNDDNFSGEALNCLKANCTVHVDTIRTKLAEMDRIIAAWT